MATPPDQSREEFERRLDQLRNEALAQGVVSGAGVRAAGGPLPEPVRVPDNGARPGYYGLPVLKAPVWKWMVAAYFFVGGLAGMSGLIGAAALLKHDWALVRAAMWQAAIGAVLSTIFLIWDLGRPMRFLHMLRVFKFQSPMSLGSWILSTFSAAAIPGVVLVEWHLRNAADGGSLAIVHGLAIAAVVGTAAAGIFLATYTGALLGVTAVPAWHLHRAILPLKFGIAGLGSAAGLLELLGFRLPALNVIGYGATIVETFVMISLELNQHGAGDRALHRGGSGWMLRIGETLEGPLSLALRVFVGAPGAAVSFILGATLTRFGWLAAGRASANLPEAVFATQSGAPNSTLPSA